MKPTVMGRNFGNVLRAYEKEHGYPHAARWRYSRRNPNCTTSLKRMIWKNQAVLASSPLLLALSCMPVPMDKTTSAGELLPDIVIDTTNIPANLFWLHAKIADCQTKSFQRAYPKTQLEFEWRITLKPGAEDFTMF